MFSNCGAGDFGFARAGFRFSVLAELERRRLDVAERNLRPAVGIQGDVRITWPEIVARHRAAASDRRPALLAACPPCQGMSTAQSRRGHANDADAGSRDPRNLLVTAVADVALELQPRAIVIENVQAFLSRKVRHPRTQAPISAARLLMDELASEYAVYPVAVDLCDFGVPQTRRRAFLTFLRRDEPAVSWLDERGLAPYPRPTTAHDHGGAPISIERALAVAGLPRLDARSDATAASVDPLHFVPVWDPRQYAMVSAIPPRSGGSAWENVACPSCGRRARAFEAVRCSRCNTRLLRPSVEDADGTLRVVRGFVNSSYRRMRPEAPAATITTASGRIGSDLTIHPWENRVLSPRECCVLQTIPEEFDWGDALTAWGHTYLRAMIGEAVPPVFTAAHGRVLAGLLLEAELDEEELLPAVDPRCEDARVRLTLSDDATMLRRALARTARARRVGGHGVATKPGPVRQP